VRVLMNRCAHKGSRLVSAPCGPCRQALPLPVPRLDLPHRRVALNIPLKNGYDGTALQECESAKGLATVKNVRLHRGFIFVKINDVGPGFEEYFGESLSSIDNMADRSPEGPARDRRRVPALPAPVQLEDVRREPQRHHASDGGARVVGGHGQADVD
jgi:phenylpropionate dioxygenase-like ring-hydroxylating dioxygenase large terminal subunit